MSTSLSPVSSKPFLGLVRGPELTFFAIIVATGIVWPYSGLSGFQLGFFLILSFAIYYSFVRRIVPLMIYLVVMLFFWVLVPSIQLKVGVNFLASTYVIPSFGMGAFLFALVHLGGILLGSRFRSARNRAGVHTAMSGKLSVVGVTCCIVIFAILVLYLGPASFVLSRVEQSALADSGGFVTVIGNATKLIPVMLVMYVLSTHPSGRSMGVRGLVLVFVVLLVVLTCNPINTARYTSLSGYLMIGLFYLLLKRKNNTLKWVVILFPVYGIFFLAVTSMMRDGFDFSLAKIFSELGTLEFSPYSIFITGLHIKNFPDHNYAISHLLIFIPHDIWTHKAGSIGMYVATQAGYVFTNVGINSFFEPFVDFGFFGLFMTSAIFGVICSAVNPTDLGVSFRSRRFMYGVIIASLSPILFRGDLGTMMIGAYAAAAAYELVRLGSRLAIRRVGQ